MGLFSKKEKVPCPVCGGEVKGLFKTKIAGKQELCQDCAHAISMHKDFIATATPEYIRENLAYRQQQAELYQSMNVTYEFSYTSAIKVKVDEGQQIFSIECNEMGSNPVIFSYNQLIGYTLLLNKKKLDDDKTPGQTFAMNMTGVFGNANNQSYDLILKTTDKYWPEIDILIMMSDSPSVGKHTANLANIGQFLKCVIRREPFVVQA